MSDSSRESRRFVGMSMKPRGVVNAVLMTIGLGAVVSIILVVFIFLAQMDNYVGKSPSSQERLFVISLIALMFLFIALIGAILFVGGYLASLSERQAAQDRDERLSRKDVRDAAMRAGGPAYFVGFEMPRIDLANVRWLRAANLGFSTLAHANLEGADLRRASFEGADLAGVNLAMADLREANFVQANLSGANMAGADLSLAVLTGARLKGADLSGAHVGGAKFEGADLEYARVEDTNLEEANLSGAILPDGSRG